MPKVIQRKKKGTICTEQVTLNLDQYDKGILDFLVNKLNIEIEDIFEYILEQIRSDYVNIKDINSFQNILFGFPIDIFTGDTYKIVKINRNSKE